MPWVSVPIFSSCHVFTWLKNKFTPEDKESQNYDRVSGKKQSCLLRIQIWILFPLICRIYPATQGNTLQQNKRFKQSPGNIWNQVQEKRNGINISLQRLMSCQWTKKITTCSNKNVRRNSLERNKLLHLWIQVSSDWLSCFIDGWIIKVFTKAIIQSQGSKSRAHINKTHTELQAIAPWSPTPRTSQQDRVVSDCLLTI